MPDIRAILESMDTDDRILWSQCRTEMRRVYLNAHNNTVEMQNWNESDDAFLDLIDIKLLILFDRAGVLNSASDLVDKKEEAKIEKDIQVESERLTPAARRLKALANGI